VNPDPDPDGDELYRGGRRWWVAVLAWLILLGMVLTVASALISYETGAEPPAEEERRHRLQGPGPGPVGPARHTGPQGRVGQFVVSCGYSHSGPDDPIVHPHHAGASHRHDFFGATGTDAASTVAELQAGGTTCDKSVDTAAYWQPALSDHGVVVVPSKLDAYYRAAPGVRPTDVVTMPDGLAMVTGDAAATAPQPGEATGWTCGSATTLHDEPPTCPATAPLHLVLTFPDCWDGRRLDSDDHRSHVAFSQGGRCPSSHPVVLPQLTTSTAYPIWGDGHALSLDSGSVLSAHGDFLNAWDRAGLRREVDVCIRRDAVCDLASNRAEEPLFSAGRS
jgi:hypothetical protein